MVTKVLVFSDLHIKSGGSIIGLDPAARFVAARDAALAAHGDADAAVLLGDLAHSGRVEEYDRLRGLLAPFEMPVIPMLGNHDDRAGFRSVFGDAPDADGFVQAVRDIGTVRIVTLDTLDQPRQLDVAHAGVLCPARLDFLDAALAGAGDRTVLVCAHHPPHPIGFPAMDAIRLSNGADLLDRLVDAHCPVHLLCGHVHRTISGQVADVPFTIFKSPCHQMPFDFTGADSSASTDEPGAYGLVLADGGSVIVHTEDVGLSARVVTGRDALP